MSEDERGDGVVKALLDCAMDPVTKPFRGRALTLKYHLVKRLVQTFLSETMLWHLPVRGALPRRSRLPAEKRCSRPHRARGPRSRITTLCGIQGSRYDLLLPDPLRMSPLPFPVHADALTASPTDIESSTSASTYRITAFFSAISTGRSGQLEVIQRVVQPASKVPDVGHE